MENPLINDLIQVNRVNFAKIYSNNKIRKSEINRLFISIESCADSIDISDEEYLKCCTNMFKVLFRVVKITKEKKDILKDIKDNLDEIERIRKNDTNKKTN